MKRILASILLLSSLLTGCTPHVVYAGHVGVMTEWGAVQPDSYPEGFYWESLFGEKIINMDARVQKRVAEASASSKDLQVVTTTIALNYRLDASAAVTIYQDIGSLAAVEGTIIDPVLQEAVKTTTARYNAEELITRRPSVKAEITQYVTASLERSNVLVTDLSIVDFKFDNKYQDAIEAKQVAEQKALTAQNDLRRIKVEADQAQARAEGEAGAMLIEARAEAEQNELLSATLTPALIQWQAIQRWDGQLPVVGDGQAIVDVGAIAARR